MNRRKLLKLAAASSLLAARMPLTRSSADPASAPTGKTRRRLRPSDPSWPSLAEWEGLNRTQSGSRRTPHEDRVTACGLRRQSGHIRLPRDAAQPAQPVFHRRPALGDANTAVGSTPGCRRRASMRSPPKLRTTSRPRSISPANTICASSSKAAGTAFTARRMRPIRC
jgi:hypothetical protein